jgi:hypothetical protein
MLIQMVFICELSAQVIGFVNGSIGRYRLVLIYAMLFKPLKLVISILVGK